MSNNIYEYCEKKEMMHIKIIKKNDNILCLTFTQNENKYFAKIFHLNNKKIKDEYNRELFINNYIIKNLKNKKYYTSLVKVYDNILPFSFFTPYIKDSTLSCNILIYEHSGNNTLKYYINKLSTDNFNNILEQVKEATQLLEDINVIHYDLYCESNIMLKKIEDRWFIKIIDYGLAYIDDTDKTKFDYNTALESIRHFNKKHKV